MDRPRSHLADAMLAALRAAKCAALCAALCALLLLPACATAVLMPSGQWVDLSWDYSSETPAWQDSGESAFEQLATRLADNGYWYADDPVASDANGSTHLDAPLKFGQGKRSVDQVPVEQLIGPGVVIDVTRRALADRDYQVTVTDLADWEISFGRMPHGAIVLLRTGYGQFWSDPAKYLGSAKAGPEGASELHFPGLHPTAAQWLANRQVGAVGIDTAGIDYGQSRFFDSHRVLASHDIPTFENVARLERLPQDGAWIVALPMKIKGGSGAPLRIVALVR